MWYFVLLQVCEAVEAAVEEDEVRLSCTWLSVGSVSYLCCSSVNCVDIHAE